MKRKEILLLLGSATFLVVAWIAFSIYHESSTSTIPDALSIRIVPIQSHFDTKTLEKLKKRNLVAPILDSVAASQAASLTPTPTNAPVSTQSASVATAGGQLKP